ncbi:hypothetical protein CGG76_16720 [Vibrio parahaemolyticus]|nr:hypothetical protein CGG76_16720 [Vibrio parahaemolyticus]
MNEYVTHGQLVEIIELFDHLSIVNAVIVVIVYDLASCGATTRHQAAHHSKT